MSVSQADRSPLLSQHHASYNSAGSMNHASTQASTSALPQNNVTGLRSRAENSSAASKKPKQERRWYTVAFELENKGSVARDHLALERTVLAWIRTSLALASIGIAITQLFRLPSSTTTPPTAAVSGAAASPDLSSLADQLASLDSTSAPTLDVIKTLLLDQAKQIEILTQQVNDPQKYRHLGKPVGGTFIALALLFLVLGTVRYFTCQAALMREPSLFPPSRRSVVFSAFCVAAIVLATFAAILSTK